MKSNLTQSALKEKLGNYLSAQEASEASEIIFRLKDYLIPDKTPQLQEYFREFFFNHPMKAQEFLYLVKDEKSNSQLCFLFEKASHHCPFGYLELSYVGTTLVPVVKFYYY